MSKSRAIRFGIDKSTGEQVDGDNLFKDAKAGNAIRTAYTQNLVSYDCIECDQALEVSKSGKDRVFFKHPSNSAYCILKENLSKAETEEFYRAIKSKESLRHKELKRKIESGLKLIDDTSEISQEARIQKDGVLKKPDVYCRYKSKEIAFEIQLSDLSYRYILDRHDFYKKHGIYLIWILDDFDVTSQDRLEKDLKYLSEHQNFFRLDETSNALKLICEYKIPFIRNNEVHSNWQKASISLSQLNFESVNYQAYYFDYTAASANKGKELEALRQTQEEEGRRADERRNVMELVDALRELHQNDRAHFRFVKSIETKLSELNAEGRTKLNSELKFRELRINGKPFINSLIASGQHNNFLELILSFDQIDKDVNAVDGQGITALQDALNIPPMQRDKFIDLLFKCGYEKNNSDMTFVENRLNGDIVSDAKEAFLSKCYFELEYALMQRAKKTNVQSVLRSIYSAKVGQLVGFGYGRENFTSLFHNIMEQHVQYGDVVLKAFRVYGQYDKLMQRKSCKDRASSYMAKKPVQDNSCDDVFSKMFPGLYQVEGKEA